MIPMDADAYISMAADSVSLLQLNTEKRGDFRTCVSFCGRNRYFPVEIGKHW
jgi:hypothetical protein